MYYNLLDVLEVVKVCVLLSFSVSFLAQRSQDLQLDRVLFICKVLNI